MLVCFNWLREFTPYEGTAQELGDRLTMLGLELEGIFDPFAALRKIVVGFVTTCEAHPEADKLSVCTVDVGEQELLSIVCGAPNVAQGQKVAVAKIGTVLPDKSKIKKSKLRGVLSMGMICSERELELSDSHAGIMILPKDAPIGESLPKALGMEDTVLDIDITSNRADCLSVLGIARETAMAFKLPLRLPDCDAHAVFTKAHRPIPSINIVHPELCPGFRARFIENVQIGPSPSWMRYRLAAMGIRPLSNIVDVTNYVMMELGQPLHSFDWDLLKGDIISIGAADEGMKFTTLDGKERVLTATDIAVWDAERPIALAGVMGGLETEIHSGSKNVLLEGAVFRPESIRKTSRRLNLPSEAASRMERGLDKNITALALARAASFMAEFSGGQVLEDVACAEPAPWKKRVHSFRRQRCEKLMGLHFSPEFCKDTLESLGCQVDSSDADNWNVTSPSYRLDLEREVDLYEEIARVYGLDRIPEVLPKIARAAQALPLAETQYGWARSLKSWARGVGLRETISYSFVGHVDLDVLGLTSEGRVSIANPMSAEQNVLRTALAPSMLISVKNNIAHDNMRLRLFEIAKIFTADSSSDTSCKEQLRICFALYGDRHAEDWPWPVEDADYLDAKGLVQHLLDFFKIGAADYTVMQGHSYYEPCIDVKLAGVSIGVIGKVKENIADIAHAKKALWMVELDADLLRDFVMKRQIIFDDLKIYPAIRRDITFVCPMNILVEDVLKSIEAHRPAFFESVKLVAEYIPDKNIEQRNLSFRLTYRHIKKNLTDKEVNKAHDTLVQRVLKELPIRL